MALSFLDLWTSKWIRLLFLCWCYFLGFFVCTASRQEGPSGLSVRVFQSIPHVLEVTCSGQVLPSSDDLLTLGLYIPPSRDMLAAVNLRKHKCMASLTFASCHVDEKDSRRTSLKVLVLDLKEGEERTFGCNAGYERDGWIDETSWSMRVRQNGLDTSVFRGHPDVLQVTCSGSNLDASWVLLTLTLYSPAHEKDKVVASVSMVQTKCTTSSSFSCCLIHPYNPRETSLVTLVTDLAVGETRSYGCSVGYETKGFLSTVTWSTELRRNLPAIQMKDVRDTLKAMQEDMHLLGASAREIKSDMEQVHNHS